MEYPIVEGRRYCSVGETHVWNTCRIVGGWERSENGERGIYLSFDCFLYQLMSHEKHLFVNIYIYIHHLQILLKHIFLVLIILSLFSYDMVAVTILEVFFWWRIGDAGSVFDLQTKAVVGVGLRLNIPSWQWIKRFLILIRVDQERCVCSSLWMLAVSHESINTRYIL